MKYFRPSLLLTFLNILAFINLSAQQTHMSGTNKHSHLIDTKLLKTGKVVLLEEIGFCGYTQVTLLQDDGDKELVLTTGSPIFHSFNELTDNDWILVLITDPSDDVPEPYTFHTIVFMDGGYQIFSTYDDQTSIDLPLINIAAVINENELVLTDGEQVYFTDFQLSTITNVELNKAIDMLRSLNPNGQFLYYKYLGEDDVFASLDKFMIENALGSDLGNEFRDYHYLGEYAILQYDSGITAFGLTSTQNIELNKKIYDYRQQGQNLRYYTLSSDSTITFKKIYVDIDGSLKVDSFDIDQKDKAEIQSLHWDGNFKGYSTSFEPLPEGEFIDYYRGYNYVLNYNLESFDLSTRYVDISIDDIEYTTSVDSSQLNAEVTLFYADIAMEITLTNQTDQFINDVHLYSSAFEGVNCAYNWLKVEQEIISLEPNETLIVQAKYESLEFNNQSYLEYPICVYAIGANNQPDENFNDNIYCLPLSEFTSTEDISAQSNFSVYPNPAQNTIRLSNDTNNSSYYIYSIHGKLIAIWDKKNTNEAFDISNLEQGTYLLVEKGTKVKRLFTKM